MDISPSLFRRIAEACLLPLIPVARRGKIIVREQYPDALDLNKNIQILNTADDAG